MDLSERSVRWQLVQGDEVISERDEITDLLEIRGYVEEEYGEVKLQSEVEDAG